MRHEDLTLINSSPEFAEAWLRWRSQPLAVAFMPMEASSAADLAERLRDSSSNLAERAASRYAWFVDIGGELVGMVGLTSVSWKMGYAEITYMVDPRVHRRGIGTAAVSLMIDRVFEESDLHKVFATVSDGHFASIAVLQKLGFKQEGRLREHYLIQGRRLDQLVFGLLRTEWVTRRCALPA